jgi:hypothetical protein
MGLVVQRQCDLVWHHDLSISSCQTTTQWHNHPSQFSLAVYTQSAHFSPTNSQDPSQAHAMLMAHKTRPLPKIMSQAALTFSFISREVRPLKWRQEQSPVRNYESSIAECWWTIICIQRQFTRDANWNNKTQLNSLIWILSIKSIFYMKWHVHANNAMMSSSMAAFQWNILTILQCM